MSWTDQDRARLFALLEGIRAILATCCEHLEEGLKRLAPPSSKRGGK